MLGQRRTRTFGKSPSDNSCPFTVKPIMSVTGKKSLGPRGHHRQWSHKPRLPPTDRPRWTPTATDPTQTERDSAARPLCLSLLPRLFYLQPLLSLQRFSSLQKRKETLGLVRQEIFLTTSPFGRAPGSHLALWPTEPRVRLSSLGSTGDKSSRRCWAFE